MFLSTLISTVCLLATPQPIQQREIDAEVQHVVQMICAHHLETKEGRLAFLTGELTPFLQGANELNQEMQDLSAKIANLEIEEEGSPAKEEAVALTNVLNEKMAELGEMLPVLESALWIDDDLQQLDTLLNKEDLDPSEKEVLFRVASVCGYLDNHAPNN
jgi:hypothetical protein